MQRQPRGQAVSRVILGTATLLAALAASAAVFAGGSPENTLLIIDPASTDSLYVGNYYRDARDIPDQNVVFMAPGAADYPAFVNYNLPALFGTLANRAIGDHIDYIVVTPGSPFYVSAPGLVSDTCSAVTRFSISGAYTSAFIADEILGGGLTSQTSNRYYNSTNTANGT